MLLPLPPKEPPGLVRRLRLSVDSMTGNIDITWSPPSNLTVPLAAYNLTYQIVGIGDCNDTYREDAVSEVLDARMSSYELHDVEPWRMYHVALVAANVAGEGEGNEERIMSGEVSKCCPL